MLYYVCKIEPVGSKTICRQLTKTFWFLLLYVQIDTEMYIRLRLNALKSIIKSKN